MTRLSFASWAMKGVVSRPSLYGVVDCARVDSRKTITTLRRLVSGVCTNLVLVGSESAASFASISGLVNSLTNMFATASLEKALPAPVALGSSERARKDTAARHAASGAGENRPTLRVGRCQPWVTRRVTTAGPTPA